MKTLLSLGFVVFFLTSFAVGQIVTTIADVQDTTGGAGGGDSHLDGQIVTVEGIVSGESWAFGGSTYYIQDGSSPWSGIRVYHNGGQPNAYGDSVRITATVTEYFGMTELTDVSEYIKLDSGKTVEPTVVTSGEIGTNGANAEAYEGVLVNVRDVDITNPDVGSGEWEVNDSSGPCRVDDAADYYFIPSNYDSVRSIVGLLNYDNSDTKIEPRLAYDVVEAGRFTRIQRIQQVRYSDLLKTPKDEVSDCSYLIGDTITVRGVVTMPTGLSYAGTGIKFIFSEPEGGPWSAILSYNPDSTAYPALFEGDIVEMTGYISEYSTGPGNMTEIWMTSPINITAIEQPIPDPHYVTTGDLRLPATGEQWGNVMVYVKDAEVVNLTPEFELFEVNDGTGSVLIDDDSENLIDYSDPPLGSIADSIRGWVYHHYGTYADSTTYKLEPLYISDIFWGVSLPPTLSNVQRSPQIPTSPDAVTVSCDVATELTIADASLYYRVDGGSYTTLAMTNTTGNTYESEIPAQAIASWVDYFIVITDIQDQTAMVPVDTSVSNLCYPVTDGSLTISDIQYTPWKLADSPFEGVDVEITGIVTVDTLNLNGYVYFPIQDADGPWNGLYVYGEGMGLDFYTGDKVTVTGTVTDYNPEWSYMFDNNTQILANSIELVSEGNSTDSETVPTGDLNSDSSDVIESYEGTLVEIQNVTLTAINTYDVLFDDGTGPCIVNDDANLPDFFVGNGFLYAFGDSLRVGDAVEMIKGSFVFSFGTYKIEVGIVRGGVVEHFTFKETEDYYPIIIENVTLDDLPIVDGDEVGVFFRDDNNDLVCGGAIIWPNTGMEAWGDDSQTPEKDGFVAGEELVFRLWDASGKAEWGPPFTVNYVAGNGTWGDGPYAQISLMEFRVLCPITLDLEEGWNWTSINVNPFVPSVVDMWAGIGCLEILKSYGGFYVPGVWDGIGDWDYKQMYTAYLACPETLYIEGQCLNPPSELIILEEGWNWVSYLPDHSIPIETALATCMDYINIVKAYNGFFVPGIWNGIGDMEPGAGYKMHVSQECTLIYPSDGTLAKIPGSKKPAAATGDICSHFGDFKTTEDYHALLIQAINGNGIDLESGDEIGVFTENELSIGGVVLTDNFPLGMMAWMDDPRTEQVDGFRSGEQMVVKYWDASEEQEYDLQITIEDGSALLGETALTKVSLEVDVSDLASVAMPTVYSLQQNYPNPFNPETTIRYGIPESGTVKLTLYSIDGQLVKELDYGYKEAGYHQVIWNGINASGESVSSGVYLYRMEAGTFSSVKKMVFLK